MSTYSLSSGNVSQLATQEAANGFANSLCILNHSYKGQEEVYSNRYFVPGQSISVVAPLQQIAYQGQTLPSQSLATQLYSMSVQPRVGIPLDLTAFEQMFSISKQLFKKFWETSGARLGSTAETFCTRLTFQNATNVIDLTGGTGRIDTMAKYTAGWRLLVSTGLTPTPSDPFYYYINPEDKSSIDSFFLNQFVPDKENAKYRRGAWQWTAGWAENYVVQTIGAHISGTASTTANLTVSANVLDGDTTITIAGLANNQVAPINQYDKIQVQIPMFNRLTGQNINFNLTLTAAANVSVASGTGTAVVTLLNPITSDPTNPYRDVNPSNGSAPWLAIPAGTPLTVVPDCTFNILSTKEGMQFASVRPQPLQTVMYREATNTNEGLAGKGTVKLQFAGQSAPSNSTTAYTLDTYFAFLPLPNLNVVICTALD